MFAEISPAKSGVGFVNLLAEDHPLARLYYSGFACGGVVMEDFDGDGRRDLFFTGGAGDNALYLQRGEDLKFEDRSADSGLLGGDRWSAGAMALDIDADGDKDLLVCNYDQAPHLFINDGKANFTDRAAQCGLTQADAYLMPTAIDYDRDGDLDLFLVSNQLYHPDGQPSSPPFEPGPDRRPRVKKEWERYMALTRKPDGKYTMDTVGRPDLLLRNDSKGPGLPMFTDVTKAAGIDRSGFGLSATWWDFNHDGWPDLHVGNDFSDPDRLYQNLGNGTFAEVARAAFPHSAWFSMGADVADVDGDGLDDLFCADMAFTTHYKQKVGMGQMGAKQALLESIQPLQVMRNHLFLNTGMGPFAEVAQMAGIAKTDWTWGVKFADLDLDGRPDLFVANGSIRSFNHADHNGSDQPHAGKTLWDLWKDTPECPEENLAFRNLGDLRFEKTGSDWGLNQVGVSHGIACGDLDGDGDPDLVVTNLNRTVSIFRNDSQKPSVVIRFKGEGGNTAGIGVRVELEIAGRKQSAHLRPSGGYLTTTAHELIFGLGEAEVIDSLKVIWADARVQVVKNLPGGKRYTFAQGDAPDRVGPPVRPRPLFAPPAVVPGVIHREALYNDFTKQPLLPHKLSQMGRASVWGDLDGDGDDDHFHGGAHRSAGVLFRNEGKGKLTPIPCAALVEAAASEDAAAAFFDADGDGDLDLYVGSGSYENDPGAPELRDRLYLNNGSGDFTEAPENALPDIRSVASCVCPADIDGDGDLDLFVGARVLPGEYPLPASSQLLINETPKGGAGRFVEKTGVFEKVGLVTDALWADLNGDGRPDLALALEWGPIRIFHNNEAGFVEATSQSGLAEHLGWWTRLAAADLDKDGDLDLVAGNFGLNTKYHADPKHPALLYYGDLTGDGVRHIIEAEFEREVLFPVRGKSCSTAAMPALGPKFATFHAFAESTLQQIYPPERLQKAEKFTCNTLESGVFLKDGGGKFIFSILPRVAQIAPVQGIVTADLNGDSHSDLVLSQNFYNPQFETGPYAGGVGAVLLGDGKGNFAEMKPLESGVMLRGDPRGLDLRDLDGDGVPDLICPLNNGPLVWQRGLPQHFPKE